jgi:hypothetical protein
MRLLSYLFWIVEVRGKDGERIGHARNVLWSAANIDTTHAPVLLLLALSSV